MKSVVSNGGRNLEILIARDRADRFMYLLILCIKFMLFISFHVNHLYIIKVIDD